MSQAKSKKRNEGVDACTAGGLSDSEMEDFEHGKSVHEYTAGKAKAH